MEVVSYCCCSWRDLEINNCSPSSSIKLSPLLLVAAVVAALKESAARSIEATFIVDLLLVDE